MLADLEQKIRSRDFEHRVNCAVESALKAFDQLILAEEIPARTTTKGSSFFYTVPAPWLEEYAIIN